MNTIQVNPDSLPTFALGSMYAGQNAADAEAENQQNLGRLFLANQREQQMLPLDIESKELANRVAQYNAAEADAKRTSPTFLNNSLSGQEGQAIQNKVAGNEAETLSPFKLAAQQAELENRKTGAGFDWTTNNLIQTIINGGGTDADGNVIPASPQLLKAFKDKLTDLTNLRTVSDPTFFGKKMINDDTNAARLEGIEARNATTLAALQDKFMNNDAIKNHELTRANDLMTLYKDAAVKAAKIASDYQNSLQTFKLLNPKAKPADFPKPPPEYEELRSQADRARALAETLYSKHGMGMPETVSPTPQTVQPSTEKKVIKLD